MFFLIFNGIILYAICEFPMVGLILLPFAVLIDVTVFIPIWSNVFGKTPKIYEGDIKHKMSKEEQDYDDNGFINFMKK